MIERGATPVPAVMTAKVMLLSGALFSNISARYRIMKKLLKLVLQGLLTVLPIVLTGYLIYWLFSKMERLMRELLSWFIPEGAYFTGLGVLAALALLLATGLLVNAYGIRYLVSLGDRIMARIPLIKSVYSTLRGVFEMLNTDKEKQLRTVVSLDIGENTRLIGFVTGEQTGNRLFPQEDNAIVGVYLPMSYQIGGYTAYVNRARLKPLDIGVEEAMRIALTGGAQNSKP